MPGPEFLDLPARTVKPRGTGITHVLDRGIPLEQCGGLLDAGGAFVDVWKFGWGISYVDPNLAAKLELLAQHRVLASPGGTLLEIAWAQGRAAAFLDWARACGFPCVEVSAGTVPMSAGDKRDLIAEAARHFIVLAEVGPKDPAARLLPEQWAAAVTDDLDAGATWVLAEGRASGTVGLYGPSGAVHTDIVDAMVAVADPGLIVFEAPRESQQAWFVRLFGPDVNLANVAPGEALGLETLRLSLRADTFGAVAPGRAFRAQYLIGPPVNLIPSQYRNVSVADVPVRLDEASLRAHLTGRPAYRRTRYLVARNGQACALAEVSKQSEQPLFSPITGVRLIAGPDESAFVDAPQADTAVPTQLAQVAARQAPQARCVVVRGRYGHVSFIVDPAPARIAVVEVVPPRPAKLVDQLTRVLDVAEDLPPAELVPELVDLAGLAATRPAGHYLFPCRAGQPGVDADVSYLDEVPPRMPWTLVGCARSRAIHDFFYGGEVDMVDMCPRALARQYPGPVLTKCCLLEDRIAVDGGLVVIPWGATLAQVKEGLQQALHAASPALAGEPAQP